MKNYRSDGETMNLVAPAGGVTSGTPYIIEGVLCVAMSDAAEGATFVGLLKGVCGLTKASGTTAAAGAAAYLNTSTKLIETSDSASNRRIGAFAEAATSGNTNARVRLDGVSFGDGNADLESKVDKIASPVAGDLVVQTAGGGIAVGGLTPAELIAPLVVAADLASETEGSDGASGVGYYDTALATGMTVAEALAVLVDGVFAAPQDVEVTVALGASTGASAANPDLIGAQIKGWHPVSGADQAVASIVVGVDGAITVTLAANSTAEAVYEVHVVKASA